MKLTHGQQQILSASGCAEVGVPVAGSLSVVAKPDALAFAAGWKLESQQPFQAPKGCKQEGVSECRNNAARLPAEALRR